MNFCPFMTKAHFLVRNTSCYEKERYGKFYVVNSVRIAHEYEKYLIEGCIELYHVFKKSYGQRGSMTEVPWIDAELEEGEIPQSGGYFTGFKYYNSIYGMWDFREKTEKTVREVTALRPNLFDIFTENERYKCYTGNNQIQVKHVKANFPVVYVGKQNNKNGFEFGKIYFVTSMTRTLKRGSYTIEGFDGEFNSKDFKEIPTYYSNYFGNEPRGYVYKSLAIPQIGEKRSFYITKRIEETLETKELLKENGNTIQRVTALKTNMFDVVTGEARYFFYF